MLFMFDAKSFLANVSHDAGVYRMYDEKDTVIYVGKAKDLKSASQVIFALILAVKKQRRWLVRLHELTPRLHRRKQKPYCLSITTLRPISRVIMFYYAMINPIPIFY